MKQARQFRFCIIRILRFLPIEEQPCGFRRTVTRRFDQFLGLQHDFHLVTRLNSAVTCESESGFDLSFFVQIAPDGDEIQLNSTSIDVN